MHFLRPLKNPWSIGFAAWILIAGAFLSAPIPLSGQDSDRPLLKAHFELGYLAVLSHRVQFGKDGTYFSYVRSGGQDNLFAVSRMSLDLSLSARNTLVFLYQPLDLETKALLEGPLRVDGLDFPAGTPMRFVYKFPFYRVSYLHNFSKNPATEFALGLSFQIRNATIEFESLDGRLFRSNRNIGPVPILKLRWRHDTPSGWWWGAEADGFYAPISYINGSENEVIGAILDASLRAGIKLKGGAEAFLNVRYLGGGAVGTDKTPEWPSTDGYVRNWLHFLTVTVGFSLALF
jgi:hypothetical protein